MWEKPSKFVGIFQWNIQINSSDHLLNIKTSNSDNLSGLTFWCQLLAALCVICWVSDAREQKRLIRRALKNLFISQIHILSCLLPVFYLFSHDELRLLFLISTSCFFDGFDCCCRWHESMPEARNPSKWWCNWISPTLMLFRKTWNISFLVAGSCESESDWLIRVTSSRADSDDAWWWWAM